MTDRNMLVCRVIKVLADSFISDMHEHYLSHNKDCSYCAEMTDEELADLAGKRASELATSIRRLQES